MQNSNTVNFKGIYYAKSAIFASDIRKGVKPCLLDSFPNKSLKDIIESSPIFNDLKDKTDVYISSYISDLDEPSTKYARNIRAIFKNPYCKGTNNIDSINLTSTGEDEIIIFKKLKNISTALPVYKNFTKEKFIPYIKMLFLGNNGCNGYIKRGENF